MIMKHKTACTPHMLRKNTDSLDDHSLMSQHVTASYQLPTLSITTEWEMIIVTLFFVLFLIIHSSKKTKQQNKNFILPGQNYA